MGRLRLHYVCIGAFLVSLGCSHPTEESDERDRQNTLTQISGIKNGRTKALHDPDPSLIEEIVSDESCAANIESLDFTDFGPDLADPRYRSLRRLPHLKSVFFYCTPNTDEFLANISGMDSLESLETELADISDSGMKHVSQCSNLTKLVLYGGNPSVGDAGLAELEGHAKLETLELINTDVTDDGLISLKRLPNLKSLVLFWEARRGKKLTDAGLKHLKSMTELKTLELSGGWVSEKGANELRQLLPDCTISTIGSH